MSGGIVLCGPLAWKRIMPSVGYVEHGVRCDWIIPSKMDCGGAIKLICPRNTLSKNCLGEATSSFLVEVEKISMEEMNDWCRDYPEVFGREYDAAAGLFVNIWIHHKRINF